MKQVYYYGKYNEINGERTWLRGAWSERSRWHYGEMPNEKEVKEYTLDEILNGKAESFCYKTCVTKKALLKKNREYKTFFASYNGRWIDSASFENAKVISGYFPFNINEVTIKVLSDKLPAPDFVAWCIDNGITALSIN